MQYLGQPAEDKAAVKDYCDKEERKLEQQKLKQSTGQLDSTKSDKEKDSEEKAKKEQDQQLEQLKRKQFVGKPKKTIEEIAEEAKKDVIKIDQ